MFEPYNNLAVLYAEQGRLDAAREALVAALDRRPDAVAYANLGDVYERLAARAYARAGEIVAGQSASPVRTGKDSAPSLGSPKDVEPSPTENNERAIAECGRPAAGNREGWAGRANQASARAARTTGGAGESE